MKEVIQNRPNADILKVLEHFDNDVGKTISAFIEGKFKLQLPSSLALLIIHYLVLSNGVNLSSTLHALNEALNCT